MQVKTKIFNFLRQVFKIPPFERWLIKRVANKDAASVYYRLVPHSNTYSTTDFRIFSRNGYKTKVFLNDYLGHCLFFNYNNPELESYRLLFGLVKNNSVCIDIGANIGYISMGMAAIARQGKVIGFEPDQINYASAIENLSLNNLPNLEIVNLGLGENSSEAVIDVQVSENRGRNRIAVDAQDGEKIIIVKLDDFLSQRNIDKVTFIKVDIEGYEYKALKGAEKTLRQCLPTLFVEIDEENLAYQGDCAKDVLEYLQNVGYTSFVNAQSQKIVAPFMDFSGQHFDLIVTA